MERASDELDSDSSRLAPLPVPARSIGQGLPSLTAPLVGRAAEMAALGALVTDPAVRLVTLTGPGGVGKTRLAIEIAHQVASHFADRVGFIGLAELRDPQLVAPTIAQHLGIDEMSDGPASDVLITALQSRELLLVIDNMEHLLPAAPLLADLLAAAPGLTILATSRGRLRLSGEREVPLSPLAVPDGTVVSALDELTNYGAIALWVSRATAANPNVRLTEVNAPAVVAICRRLDGLPLAIELAAAWSHLLSPEAVLARLKRRLHLLTDGPRDAPVRLQTMRAAIAWSFDLLAAPERALVERLAVFTGGCTLDAAERIVAATSTPVTASPSDPATDAPPSVLALVSGLVDKGLLQSITAADGEPRLLMLEMVREYSLEQLAISGGEDIVRCAHAACLLDVVATAAPGLEGPEQAVWFSRIEAEIGNIRGALAWLRDTGRIEDALRLAGALAWFWTAPNYIAEGRLWFDALLSIETEASPPVRARALVATGDLANWHNDSDRAIQALDEALALWRRVDDRAQIAATLRSLGSVEIDRGDFARADALLEVALDIASAIGDTWTIAACGNMLGMTARLRGDWQGAARLHEEAIRRSREIDDGGRVVSGLCNLGWAYLHGGDLPRAWESLDAALTLDEPADDDAGLASCLEGFAGLAGALQLPAAAVRLMAAASAQRARCGLPPRPPIQADNARRITAWEAALGAGGFAAAWNAGRSLSRESAIAEARAIPRPPAQTRQRGGLSPREHEVLVLLADGATDGEIADRLFISNKTASKHVATILEKLGVANRTAAAALAVRRGLV